MKKLITILVCFGILLFAAIPGTYALSLLVSQGVGVEFSGGMMYQGYGFHTWAEIEHSWTNMTTTLDTATENNVDVVTNFEDLNLMLSYDALWLDIHLDDSPLSATEISNITTFIGTGKRVVMIGENNNLLNWNNSIMDVVGGTMVLDNNSSGRAYTTIDNELTYGVNSVLVQNGGLASGGIALFDQNFATLWGDNVLTILDTHMKDRDWAFSGNPQFFTNVANWIAGKSPQLLYGPGPSPEPVPEPIPEPTTILLLGSGLIGLFGFRRKFKRR